MAVVSISYHDPWVVARWAFGRLIDRTAERLSLDADHQTLVQAKALDGIHFYLLEESQAKRISSAMCAAADQLRLELLGVVTDDPRDAEFAEALGELAMWLHDVFES